MAQVLFEIPDWLAERLEEAVVASGHDQDTLMAQALMFFLGNTEPGKMRGERKQANLALTDFRRHLMAVMAREAP